MLNTTTYYRPLGAISYNRRWSYDKICFYRPTLIRVTSWALRYSWHYSWAIELMLTNMGKLILQPTKHNKAWTMCIFCEMKCWPKCSFGMKFINAMYIERNTIVYSWNSKHHGISYVSKHCLIVTHICVSESSSVQEMTRGSFGAKTLTEPMLTDCQFKQA